MRGRRSDRDRDFGSSPNQEISPSRRQSPPNETGKAEKNPQLFRCLEPPVHFPGILLIILVQPFQSSEKQLIITGSPLDLIALAEIELG